MNNLPTESKKIKPILFGLLTICFGVVLYFGYDYHQSIRYKEEIGSVYRAFGVIDQEAMRIYDKSTGKRYIDIFDEIKDLKKKVKDLKLKISDVVIPNAKSKELNEKFNGLLDLQCDILDNYTILLQSQMDYQSEENYIRIFSDLPYDNNLNEAKAKMEKSKRRMDDAYKQHDLLMDWYKDKKEKFDLSIK